MEWTSPAAGSVAYRKKLSPGEGVESSRLADGVCGRDGSVRQRPLLGPGGHEARPRGEADPIDLCQAFREEAQVMCCSTYQKNDAADAESAMGLPRPGAPALTARAPASAAPHGSCPHRSHSVSGGRPPFTGRTEISLYSAWLYAVYGHRIVSSLSSASAAGPPDTCRVPVQTDGPIPFATPTSAKRLPCASRVGHRILHSVRVQYTVAFLVRSAHRDNQERQEVGRCSEPGL